MTVFEAVHKPRMCFCLIAGFKLRNNFTLSSGNFVHPTVIFFPCRGSSDIEDIYSFAVNTINTPGKLSQVPPRRYRLNGCDRYPELPVMVKN